MMSKESGH